MELKLSMEKDEVVEDMKEKKEEKKQEMDKDDQNENKIEGDNQ